MKYTLSIPKPSTRFIEIEMQVDNVAAKKIYFQLPSWRPGRYELGNFAKNIQRWDAYDGSGNKLPCRKITRDKWEVDSAQAQKIIARYNYFATQPDAGGCFLDNSQLYVNPVHCCMYVEGQMDQPYELEIIIPAEWEIACALKGSRKNILTAKNFDELADSPFIASAALKKHSFEVRNTTFHIAIHGECRPDWMRIEKDFRGFIEIQIGMMGDFPCREYYFLVQALPYNFYHGVEHSKSTVLAIGPGNDLMNENLYPEFLGVASHELFHVWNVKTIRPADMLPYDFTKENYSLLGFVYEGFTTYYGDLFLIRSEFFTLQQYLEEVSARLQKHMDNYGRFNYSVAQSSFDTWLDGYVPGIPHRKTSIYDEGSLIALMLDFVIRKTTGSKKSLDDVMRILYNDFGKTKTGYTESDIQKICEKVSNRSFGEFFRGYINQAVSYETLLGELLDFAGLQIVKRTSAKSHENLFGFRTELMNGINKVLQVIPGSPADGGGLSKDDEIISINGNKVSNNLQEWCSYYGSGEISMGVFTQNRFREVSMVSDGKNYFLVYTIVQKEKLTDTEKQFLRGWLNLK